MTLGPIIAPRAPSGDWETLTPNEKAWIEFIRIISAGTDPKITPARVRALTELIDAGPGGSS